jgi:hypothetical protein
MLLSRELEKRGSWCGETHIQKATFFLQELLGVDSGFEFILYRHGPFSFELRDELTAMQADNLLQLMARYPGYGPSYHPTEFSDSFLERFPKTAAKYISRVRFVADEFWDKGVAELERLATAFFLAEHEGLNDVERRATRLVEIKPHISLIEARSASVEMDRIAHCAQVAKKEYWAR